MAVVFGRHNVLIGAAVCALLAAPAAADTFDVGLDQARLLKIPERVRTVVIGNPLIADATLQSGGLLVITGKGYGRTNLLALDHDGRVIMSRDVEVRGPGGADLVVVYRGTSRETYSCAPQCQPRITLGDGKEFFNDTIGQVGARSGAAQGNLNAGAAALPQPAR
jgi:hypothetical protein